MAQNCPDGNLNINRLYCEQALLCHTYRNHCGLAFVRLCKFSNTRFALLYGSIFNRTHYDEADFRLLDKLHFFADNVASLFFRLVICIDRDSTASPDDTMKVTMDNVSFTANLTTAHREDDYAEYLVDTPFRYYLASELPQLKLATGITAHAQMSYMFMCFE